MRFPSVSRPIRSLLLLLALVVPGAATATDRPLVGINPAPVTPGAATATDRPLVGINPAPVTDWSGDQLFADAFRNSRGCNAPGQFWDTTTAVPADAAGWPKADFGVLVASLPSGFPYSPVLDGTYGVRFTGQATITGSLADLVVAQRYDAATNTTTARVAAKARPDATGVELTFTGTRRLPTDPPGTGLTDLRIMRPIAAGSTTPHGFDEVFSRHALRMLAPFGFLRNLDLNGTNGGSTALATWSSRVAPSAPLQGTVAYEHQVALANALGVDLWFTVSMWADDDHARKLFQLCRYGSDGTDPYTSDQANPVHPPLRGRLIVEHCNELWNYSFPNAHANLDLANREVEAGSDIGRDGDQFVWATRRAARGIVRLRDIAAGVYGEDAFGARFLPVYMGQLVSGDPYHLRVALDEVARDGRPIARLLAAAGSSWYHSPPDPAFAAPPPDRFADLEGVAAVVGGHGLPLACYEGGEVVEGTDAAAYRAAQADARFGPHVTRTIDLSLAAGARLLGVYGTTQPPWGLADTVEDLATVKYTATVAAIVAHDAGPVRAPAPAATPSLSDLMRLAVAARARADASLATARDAGKAASDARVKADASYATADLDRQAADDADAAIRAGLDAIGKPAVQKQADGSLRIIAPAASGPGVEVRPAVDADSPLPSKAPAA